MFSGVWVTRVTDSFTATKIGALLLIVAFGACNLFEGNTHYFEDPVEDFILKR